MPKGCCAQCKLPTAAEVKKILKQLAVSVLGMVAAFSTNDALRALWDKLGIAFVIYAILTSWLSIIMLGAIRLKFERKHPDATEIKDERVLAMITLAKISFCMLSATVWKTVVLEGVDDEWVALAIAGGLSVGLVIFLILVFLVAAKWVAWMGPSKNWSDPTKRKHNCAPCLAWTVHHHFAGLIVWTDLTFGWVIACVWSVFFGLLIRNQMNDVGGTDLTILFNFIYAVLTFAISLIVIVYSDRVYDRGCGCCSCRLPGRAGEPCWALRGKESDGASALVPVCCCTLSKGQGGRVADAMISMFHGSATALCAFAWNDAFRSIWTGTDINERGDLGILAAYAVLATFFGVICILLVKRLPKGAKNPDAVTQMGAKSGLEPKSGLDKKTGSGHLAGAAKSGVSNYQSGIQADPGSPSKGVSSPKLFLGKGGETDGVKNAEVDIVMDKVFFVFWNAQVRKRFRELVVYTWTIIIALACNDFFVGAWWEITGTAGEWEYVGLLLAYAAIMVILAIVTCHCTGEALAFGNDLI